MSETVAPEPVTIAGPNKNDPNFDPLDYIAKKDKESHATMTVRDLSEIEKEEKAAAKPKKKVKAAPKAEETEEEEAKPAPKASAKPKIDPDTDEAGEEEDSDEEEPLQAKKAKAESEDEEKPKTYKFKAAGKDHEMTAEQMVKRLQQSIGGEKAHQELRKLRDTHQTLIDAVKEAFTDYRFSELAEALGVPYDPSEYATAEAALYELNNNPDLTDDQKNALRRHIKKSLEDQKQRAAAKERYQKNLQRVYSIANAVGSAAVQKAGLGDNPVFETLVHEELRSSLKAGVDPSLETVLDGVFESTVTAAKQLMSQAAESDDDYIEMLGEDTALKIARAYAKRIKDRQRAAGAVPAKTAEAALAAVKKRPQPAQRGDGFDPRSLH